MKIGDRDTPNTRIYSEREFREDCQVLVATEAAGISVAIIAVVQGLGSKLKTTFTSVQNALN